MKIEFDTFGLKPKYVVMIAVLTIALLIFGAAVTIVKVSLSLDAPWLTELAKPPRFKAYEAGTCTMLMDQQTGATVKEICRPPEQEAKLQELAGNLRKLTAELAEAKIAHQKSQTGSAQVITQLRANLKAAEDRRDDFLRQIQESASHVQSPKIALFTSVGAACFARKANEFGMCSLTNAQLGENGLGVTADVFCPHGADPGDTIMSSCINEANAVYSAVRK